MEALQQFEKELIEKMLDRPDSQESGHTAEDMAKFGAFLCSMEKSTQVKYEHTGVGYFETISHQDIPSERIVIHPSGIYGKIDGSILGFVLFFEDGELTIDCHSLSDHDCPSDARERGVSVVDERITNLAEQGSAHQSTTRSESKSE